MQLHQQIWKKIWKKSKVSIDKRIKLYKTLVKTVLTYNYSTWALTKNETEILNRIHRKQRDITKSLEDEQ